MARILGIDLGTNSIGWAVVDKNKEEHCQLVDKGVRIFQEGVKIDKGIERSKAEERTKYRSARRLKYRRKLRKIQLLRVLSKYGYCPVLTSKELNEWKYKKIYPLANAGFMKWQKTDEASNQNPYYFRNLAATKKLDLAIEENRFILGRAFYHMAQRRGFLSNRNDISEPDKKPKDLEIYEREKVERGSLTLGQSLYQQYLNGEKIRLTKMSDDASINSSRISYIEEFEKIYQIQELPEKLVSEIKKAIFFQRPLKSQKGLIGNCPFEKNKPRCPVSHPLFEEYRMYAFINNIRIRTPEDDKLRELQADEKDIILPLFYRKTKEHFNFEDIAKKLTPKGTKYCFYKPNNKTPGDYQYNFDMRTTVSGCITISQLIKVFGDDWRSGIRDTYKLQNQKTGKKTTDELVNDVWHVLFSFDKAEKLVEFAINRLGFDNEKAEQFSKISLKKDYTSLSLKAIKKILPFLKEQGLIYSHAVFMANLENVVPSEVWKNESNKLTISNRIRIIIQTQNDEKQLAEIVNGIISINRGQGSSWGENQFRQKELRNEIHQKLVRYYGETKWGEFSDEKQTVIKNDVFVRVKKQMSNNLGRGEYLKTRRIDERVKSYLADEFNIEKYKLDKLYHPAAVEVYKNTKRAEDGNYYLGSPMISSIRNPMAMRALHQLRKVINELIREGVIDRDTKVHIEMARGLKNANERNALQTWQRRREAEKEKYREQLKRDIKAATGRDIEPSERDILKYQLWEEQKHICLYTGETIGVAEFIGDNPKYDIEHTIPRSQSFDNSQVNLTLCNSEYNRFVKRNQIPSKLHDHEKILQRLDQWKEYIKEAKIGIEKATRQSRANSDNKQAKDYAIQQRHLHRFNFQYWKQKCVRFEMKDVPEGFKNSQLVDTGIITKYARLYLKTVFNSVYTVKGKTVADFRQLWGIQGEYSKKERLNHAHHCIDAITIACIDKKSYEELASAYHQWEGIEQLGKDEMPYVEKPWPEFAENLKQVENEIIISHYTPDNLPKQTRKVLRIRGKRQKNKSGNFIVQKGHTVRGSLHKETSYGAIKRMVQNKNGESEEKTLYVVRKPLDVLTTTEIKNIVDDRIRAIVNDGKLKEIELKKELDHVKKALKDAEAVEELTNLQIQADELNDKLSKLFVIKNKDGSITPIRKVRCIATTVTNPLHIKKHRDSPKHDYKQYSHFANDGNYMMAIYEGKNSAGKIKRDFVLVNNLNAGKYFLGKLEEDPIPEVHKNSALPFKSLLKTGTMVILWEKEPEEIWKLSKKELSQRMYKCVSFENDGRVILRFHKEARQDKELKRASQCNFESPEPKLRLSMRNLKVVVEGFEFKISPTGRLIKLSNL